MNYRASKIEINIVAICVDISPSGISRGEKENGLAVNLTLDSQFLPSNFFAYFSAFLFSISELKTINPVQFDKIQDVQMLYV